MYQVDQETSTTISRDGSPAITDIDSCCLDDLSGPAIDRAANLRTIATTEPCSGAVSLAQAGSPESESPSSKETPHDRASYLDILPTTGLLKGIVWELQSGEVGRAGKLLALGTAPALFSYLGGAMIVGGVAALCASSALAFPGSLFLGVGAACRMAVDVGVWAVPTLIYGPLFHAAGEFMSAAILYKTYCDK